MFIIYDVVFYDGPCTGDFDYASPTYSKQTHARRFGVLSLAFDLSP